MSDECSCIFVQQNKYCMRPILTTGLLCVALARMITDNGERIPLDDVLAELGLTREELADLDPDVDEA